MNERRYGDLPGGHRNTIHDSHKLDVEVHNGKVVAVWFRCAMLPFEQIDVDAERANDMRRHTTLPDLLALIFEAGEV